MTKKRVRSHEMLLLPSRSMGGRRERAVPGPTRGGAAGVRGVGRWIGCGRRASGVGEAVGRLVRAMSAEELARVGDAVVDCDTGDELLAVAGNGAVKGT